MTAPELLLSEKRIAPIFFYVPVDLIIKSIIPAGAVKG